MDKRTGQIVEENTLSERQKGSRFYAALTQKQLRGLAQIETERLAQLNAGVTVALVDARLARAEAKRARKRRHNQGAFTKEAP